MSLILDALNRSRDDANPVPGLSTHHPVAQVSVNRRQYLLWVALCIAIVVIAWLFMERYSAPKPARHSDASTAQPAATADAIATGPVVMPPPTVAAAPPARPELAPAPAAPALPGATDNPAQTVPADGVAAVPPPAERQPGEVDRQGVDTATVTDSPTPTPTPTPAAVPEPAAPVNEAIARLYENPDLAEEPEVRRPQRPAADSTEQTIDVDTMIKLAQQEAKNLGLTDHPVPLLIDLSQQVKDSIPTVYYLRHDYSSDSARSTVVLNSKTLSVGGSPAAGMKVEEILPDSVVLNYQGTQFRLRALNSWINL
ncbi:MAG: general secretion pathway protein GspB [Halioglobus sp.]|nr:general secretion pathway protein GspB [Halioglobus sp.]